jgi:hypothetical protein
MELFGAKSDRVGFGQVTAVIEGAGERRGPLSLTTVLSLGICLIAGGAAGPAFAQTVTATLAGTVSDETGANIPGAKVTARNQQNGFTRTTKSGGSGLFTFAAVDSGDYTLRITAPNFRTSVIKNIHLDPGDTRTLNNLHLAVGTIDETVVVEAAETSLDTGERSSLITADVLKKLSVEGRDVTELLKILPGTAIAAGGASQQGALGASNSSYDPGNVSPGGALGQYAVAGSPTNGVSIRSDGANLADPANYASATQNINSEATAEVKVQESNFGADVANGPVVIDAVGKSGGTEYHGSLYVFGRTYQLNSTDAFAAPLNTTKPPDHYVYPGGTFGGPVEIPGTNFNHAKRLTFFVSAEEYAQRNTYAYGTASSAISSALVPTVNMRKGDFSAAEIAKYLPPLKSNDPCIASNNCLINSAGQKFSPTYANLYSIPITGANGAAISCNGNTGNDCLSPYLDPGASAIINNAIPLPNVPGGQNINGFNYSRLNLTNNDLYQTRGRLDFAESERSKFYFIYNVERGGTTFPQSPGYYGSGDSGGVNQPGGTIQSINSQSLSTNFAHIFSNTLTNEAFVTATYYYASWGPGRANLSTSAAIKYPYQNGIADGSVDYPQLLDYNYDGLPIGLFQDYSYGPIYSRKFDPGFGDNLTKLWGRHTAKFGINIERPLNNQAVFTGANLPSRTQGAIENYYVPNVFANQGRNYYSTCYTTAGYCNNNNLLGTFEEGIIQDYKESSQIPKANLYYWSDAFYATDDWKITKRLSLTFGLRAEHISNWTDKHGVGASVFNPATINQSASAKLPLPGFTWHGLDSSVPVAGFATRALFYEPHFGLSYDVYGDGKTTFGGGYAQYRYHDGWFDAQQAIGTASGLLDVTLQNVNGANGLTLSGLRDTYDSATKTGSVTGGFKNADGTANTSGTPVFALDGTDNQAPLTSTYSATVTQVLPHDSVISIGYAGNSSKYILNDGSNQPVVVDNANAIPLGGLFRPDPNPKSLLYGTVFSPYQLNGLTQAQLNDYRPYVNYSTIQVEAHKLYSNYNSLQLTWTKRKGRVNFGANYTYSKALGVRGGFQNGSPADSFDLHHSYGALNYDRSQIFNIWYYLPVGSPIHGNALLKQLGNNWAFSGYTGLQSGPNLQSINYTPNFGINGQIAATANGTPIQVLNTTFLGTPDVSLQPVLTCDPRVGLQKHQYMNGSCFKLPQIGGQNGQYNFPYIHGPAYFQSDLTLIKVFPIKAERNVEFRAAAFNFLNHPLSTFSNSFLTETQLHYSNLNSVDPSAASSTNGDFGTTPYKAGRRVMELSVKYSF